MPSLRVRLVNAALGQEFVLEIKMSNVWSNQVCTLADAYKERAALQYVVSGLFPLPSLSIVYGAPGTLKSLLLADMAICVASGNAWLPPASSSDGCEAFNVLQTSTLWIDLDNGKRRTDERVEALGKAYDLSTDIPFYYISMPSPWLNVSKSTSTDNLVGLIKDLNTKLIVIDNLGVIRGKTDENSAEMTDIMSTLRNLTEKLETAIVLIHHQRKSSGVAARAGDALRGHSSIEAAIDLALLVERDEGSALINLRSTKTRGADIPLFGAQFVYSHKPGTTELATACFYGWTVEDLISDAAVEREIIEVVAQHQSINKGSLINVVKKALPKVSVIRIRAVIDRLHIQHQLDMLTGADNAKCYSIPNNSITAIINALV